jgi:hypothetical protein
MILRPRSAVPFAFFLLALVQASGCEPAPSPVPGPDASETGADAVAEAFDRRAAGTFEPVVTPEEGRTTEEGSELGRARLEKRFHGDLEGTAEGWMLTALTPTEGSAGYVAIEEVRGTLEGREGAFILQHNGLMDRGAQSLVIHLVPDSGTGELEGIAGRMTITIDEEGYRYELFYTLPGG